MNDLALGLLGLKPIPAQSLCDTRRFVCRDDGDHQDEVVSKIKATSKGGPHHGKWVAIQICRAIAARGPLDAAQLTSLLGRHRTTICAAGRYAVEHGLLTGQDQGGHKARLFSITDKGRAMLRGEGHE